MRMSSVGRYVFRLRSYELGPRGQASLASLCHLLQEAAARSRIEPHVGSELGVFRGRNAEDGRKEEAPGAGAELLESTR